jgi:3-oxoacyl-(acyl-carrier-protein) synthase
LNVPTKVVRRISRPWAYALRAYLSNVFSGRCIDPYDVDTYKLQVRCDFAELIDDMPPEDLREFGPFVNVVQRIVETAFDDAKSDGRAGRKGMLIKVKRGELAVGMQRGPAPGGKQ